MADSEDELRMRAELRRLIDKRTQDALTAEEQRRYEELAKREQKLLDH